MHADTRTQPISTHFIKHEHQTGTGNTI